MTSSRQGTAVALSLFSPLQGRVPVRRENAARDFLFTRNRLYKSAPNLSQLKLPLAKKKYKPYS